MAKTVIKSFRAQPDVWDRLEALASAKGQKVNSLGVQAIEALLAAEDLPAPRRRPSPKSTPRLSPPAPAAPSPHAVLAQAQASAAHLAKPKPPARHRWWSDATKSVPVGPVHREPGSMLKGAHKGPKR